MIPKRPHQLVQTEMAASIKGLKSGRRLGDVKVAPSSFQARLREIDPGLSAHWNRIRCIWQIWGKSQALGQAVVLHVCEGDATTGTFRPLDGRVFQVLKQNDGHSRDVVGEMADNNIANVENHDRAVEATDRDYIEQEMQPRLKYDMSREVSHSKSGISVGAMNIPKEDVAAMMEPQRRGTFGAAAPPKHLAHRSSQEMDIDIEAE